MNIKVNKKTEYNLVIDDTDWGNEDINYKVNLLADLFDPIGYRRTGRSTMLALAFIKLAFRYQDRKINITDHFLVNNLTNRQSFIRKIEELVKTIPWSSCDGVFEYNLNDFTVMFKTTENKSTWVSNLK